MRFCPKCESMLTPKQRNKKSITLVCPRCGYKTHSKVNEEEQFHLKSHIRHKSSDKIVIADEAIQNLPSAKVECPKCQHGKAFTWELQTRSSDEPTTIFFRCQECGHTWREY